MRKFLLLGLVALLAGGAAIWANPGAPDPPPTFDGPMEPANLRAGVYSDAAGAEWLVVPDLSGGAHRFALDGVNSAEPHSPDDNLTRLDDQPYTIEDVALDGETTMSGWLVRPAQPSGAGLVILHGSGNSDRENGYYIAWLDRLARQGHTLILPDKRGSGRSGGDWRNAPLSLLARDGAEWMELLRSRTALPAYGFFGISQGGSIAPDSARLAGADFAVAIGTSMTALANQLRHEIGNDVRAAGVPTWLQGTLADLYTWRAKRRQPGFWDANGDYSPLDRWREWRGPTFVAYGREDESDNVPVSASLTLLDAAAAEGPLDYSAYPGASHGLVAEDGEFADSFLRDLFGWLEDQQELAEDEPGAG